MTDWVVRRYRIPSKSHQRNEQVRKVRAMAVIASKVSSNSKAAERRLSSSARRGEGLFGRDSEALKDVRGML